jgi:hypothetical protein
MEVTVDDDGKTEVRHVYTVSAPIAGKVLRISHPRGEEGVSRHVGDQVTVNETIVAVMQPTAPGFIDFRTREEGEAAVAAADARPHAGGLGRGARQGEVRHREQRGVTGEREGPDRGLARRAGEPRCAPDQSFERIGADRSWLLH